MLLGIFTLINIYLTITYYLELRNKTGEKGKFVKQDFVYSSDNNPHFLKQEELIKTF